MRYLNLKRTTSGYNLPFAFFHSSAEKRRLGGHIQVSHEAGVKKIIISNVAQRNALSLPILHALNNEFSTFQSSGMHSLQIDFDSEGCDYSCSGFDLFAFDVPQIQQAKDLMPPNHPANQTVNLLWRLSQQYPTEIHIRKHVIGFGLVLASMCQNIVWHNPEHTKTFLPHFRLGIGFPLLPMLGLMDRFGIPLAIELLLINRSIKIKDLIQQALEYKQLTADERNAKNQLAVQSLQAAGRGEIFEVGAKSHKLEDRTGALAKMAQLHILQAEIFTSYAANLDRIPVHVQQQVEQLRVATITPALAEAIQAHRTMPKNLNHESLADHLPLNTRNSK